MAHSPKNRAATRLANVESEMNRTEQSRQYDQHLDKVARDATGGRPPSVGI